MENNTIYNAYNLGKFAYYAFTAKGGNRPKNPFKDLNSKVEFKEGYKYAYYDQCRRYLAMKKDDLVLFFHVDEKMLKLLNVKSVNQK